MIALMKRIFAVAGRYRGRIGAAFVFAFVKSVLAKAPLMLAFVALTAFYRGAMTPALCIRLGLVLAVCLIVQILCQHAADRLQSAAGYLVFAHKRMELGAHLRRMPMGYFTEGNIGKISSVLSTDMVFIEENCMTELANMMNYAFSEGIMLAFLFGLNGWLGLAGVAVALAMVCIGRGMTKSSLADGAARQEQSECLTEAVLDFVEGIGIIKTYNLLGQKSKELTENFERMCATDLRFEENQAPWQRRLNLCYALGSAAMLALAVALYSLKVLDVTYLLGMVLFVFDLFGPLRALYSQSTRLTVMNSCLDRVEEVFAQCELPDTGTQAVPAPGDAPEVRFEHVSFAYGEKEVLHDVSFDVGRNQMVALVGPSGGGKSTIASLLTRFWDVKEGRVLIRGKDVRDIPVSALMDQISMVFQRVYLFRDTVYNNISMGRPDATREEVEEAAKKARCYDFIMALPNGFDTVIGEGGESLSGGERQRISIARCILKDAPIVILDEATASVDADNESAIQEAIGELCRGKTLLVIAHRLPTIRHADEILVVSRGRIAQRGTHGSLMAQTGIYRNFVTAREQAKGWGRSEPSET